jgi:DNA polymerase-1
MEAVGIAVDLGQIESEIVTGELRMAELVDILGGNPGSPKFLAKLFFDDLHLPVVKISEKTSKPSFDKYAMEEYELLLAASDNETAGLVLEYRGWAKTVSSNYKAYLDLLSPDGYLRPNYKVHGTRTRRLSCEKPNLQQIPRSTPKRWNGNLKKAFIARPGYTLYEFDYAQLELRLAAVYSGDETLLHAFRSKINIFTAMASVLGWLRHDCKTFTYTILYGGGDRRVSVVFKVTPGRAHRMREEFYESYPALRTIQKKAAHLATVRGYLKLWTGLRRHFLDPESDAHKAFNSLTQGGAAEIVKHTGIKLGKTVDWDECKVLLQVHDSYVCEIKNGTEDYWIPIVRGVMEDVGSLNEAFKACPFTVEAKQWATDNVYTKDLEDAVS